MGAVQGEAQSDLDDPKLLGVRDTVPAPPMVPASAKDTGAQRRMTREGIPHPTPVPVSKSVPTAPASGPPEGRYSSAVAEEEVVPLPPASKGASRRSFREPLRVDDVGATNIVASRGAALNAKPRLLSRERISDSPLSARDAFILSLVDGALTVQDLVDAAGMPEPEVSAILARLSRLGIVSVPT
jgi:uncharacterized membrane protein